MALSVKLSSSVIRPFGFSFSRQNGVLTSCPIVSHQHCWHHQSASVTRHRLSNVPNSHMLVLSRSVSNVNKINNSPLPVIDDSETVLLTKSVAKEKDAPQDDSSKPNEEQLLVLADKMGNHLPQFFKVPHDFRMYNKGIVFEDNIRNVKTVGLNSYAWQIALVKMGAHFKYGKVNMEVLKITSHVEDGTIRVRWRVVTFPGNSIVFAFWQFKLWNSRESFEQHKDGWIDGFSIFQVGGDGLIHKHICDKVIPDPDQVKTKKSENLAVKLGIALGLVPGEHFGENFLTEILSSL